MNILSLFDGMACGMLAMQKAGVEVDRYVACEIDKYAVQTSTHNFPMIEHRGDVFQADFSEFSDFDFLVGGSPCTYWSIAQNKNRETEASGLGWELFSQYVRALHEAKPKFFIYENNKSMSKVIRASIDEAFGFEAVCINSALVSAQNRQRLYWVGKRNEDGTYSKVNVEQPEDRGILLKHILERGYDLTGNDKSYCLTASYDGACAWNTIERSQRSMVAEPVCAAERGRYNDDGVVEQRFEAREDGKTNVLTTVQKDNNVAEPVRIGAGAKTGLYAVPVSASLIEQPFGRKKLENGKWDRRYEARDDSKSNTLVATHQQQFGMVAVGVPYYAEPCLWGEGGKPIKAISRADGKTYDVYEVKDGQITIKGKQYPIKLADGYYIIRKLTVRECMRLQTVPEWYEFPVSDSQAYKMLGNGWTVDVIVHLITSALGDK